jgi:hypothetical protein
MTERSARLIGSHWMYLVYLVRTDGSRCHGYRKDASDLRFSVCTWWYLMQGANPLQGQKSGSWNTLSTPGNPFPEAPGTTRYDGFRGAASGLTTAKHGAHR